MEFVCPSCNTVLIYREESYYCSRCQKDWAIKDGIPIFINKNFYWGEIPVESMRKFLDLVVEKSWDEANKFLNKNYPNRSKFVYEPGRADFRFLVPLNEKSVVLDAGSGWGTLSVPLSKICQEVVSFDSTIERVKFLDLLTKKEGIKNIKLFAGDILNLPLRPKSFDLIIMNGLLEWVGQSQIEKNPRDVQKLVLKKCLELLKDDGYLYIGIENRFALAYLTGGIDHSGLRLTSWLPRYLANIYTKIRKGVPYRTYTYTKRGYTKLLKEAGFNNPTFYLPIYGYNEPKFIVPYNKLPMLRYLILQVMGAQTLRKRVIKFLVRSQFFLRIYRYLFFSYNIILKK